MTGVVTRSRNAGLDILRGLAVALVLIRHAWSDVFGSSGIVGVVMFFALSGYLITGLLLHDLHRHGRVRFGRFYRNRALRLVPPLVLLLAVLSVVMIVWDPLGDRDGLGRALVTGLTYTANLPYNHGSGAVLHLWTLATEEQFYLFWPVLLAVALRWNRLGLLIVAATAAILALLATSMWVVAPDIGRVYPLPTSWAVAMVIGAAARIWEGRLRAWLPRGAPGRAAVGAVALAILLALCFVPENKASPLVYLVLGPVVAVGSVVLIQIWSDWADPPTPLLRPLLALGTVSYAAYLWNAPIVLWLGGGPMPWPRAVASIVLTLLAATISWWLLERPIARWRASHDAPSGAVPGATEGPTLGTDAVAGVRVHTTGPRRQDRGAR